MNIFSGFSLVPFFKFFSVLSIAVSLIACGGGVTGNDDNYIAINDQVIVNLNQITVAEAKVNQSVWIVIYESDGDSMGDKVIGLKNLDAGEYSNVTVQLERSVAQSELLFAELRIDAGVKGKFEPGNEDRLIAQDPGEFSISAVSFSVARSTTPLISISDVTVRNEKLIFDRVVADREAWLVIRVFDQSKEKNLGMIIGTQKLSAGHHPNLPVQLLPSGKSFSLEDGDKIIVALYENAAVYEEGDDFDSANDHILSLNGDLVLEELQVKIATP